jgi:hypothetical protein
MTRRKDSVYSIQQPNVRSQVPRKHGTNSSSQTEPYTSFFRITFALVFSSLAELLRAKVVCSSKTHVAGKE